MQEQKMVERKKDEKMGSESGMRDTAEPDQRKASGGSNLSNPYSDTNLSNPYANADQDKQFSQKESEMATGRRGETGSEMNFQSQDKPGMNKDWSSEQGSGTSPNTGSRTDESMTSEKDVDEQKKASEKEDLKRKSQY